MGKKNTKSSKSAASSPRPKSNRASASKPKAKAAGKKTAKREAPPKTKPAAKKKTAAAKAKRPKSDNGASTAAPTKAPSKRSPYEVPPQVNNEKLTRAQVSEMKRQLEVEHLRLIQEIKSLSGQTGNMPKDQANRFGNHLADVASDSQLLETMLVQSGMEADRLRQVNEAIDRIEQRKYGICERCGGNIGHARLVAKPFARFCIKCREHLEAQTSRGRF